MIQYDFSFPFPLTSKLECGNLPGREDKGPNLDNVFVSKYTVLISSYLAPMNKNYSKDHLFTF